MTRAQFLVDPLPEEEVVVLDGPEGRHAATVRRIQPGEEITLTDGRGGIRVGVVARVGNGELAVRCGAIDQLDRPDPRIVVVQALAKGERGELAVQLLTELGVDEIVPWPASRCVVVWRGDRGHKALQRWRSTAREAGKQSRRAWLAQVSDPATTVEVCTRIAACQLALVLQEGATTSIGTPSVLHAATAMAQTDPSPSGHSGAPGPREILLVVGPEGGIASEELEAFLSAGAVAVALGTPVLRTSTAGAAAVAALSVPLGRWA